MKKLSAVERHAIDQYLAQGKDLESLSICELIPLMRKRLRMSQKQLAKRASVSVTTINRLEKGEMEPTLGLLRKLFDAMACDFLLLPVPRKEPDVLLRERAEGKARGCMDYLEGTMVLEEQGPDQSWMDVLREQEIDEILEKGIGLWDED